MTAEERKKMRETRARETTDPDADRPLTWAEVGRQIDAGEMILQRGRGLLGSHDPEFLARLFTISIDAPLLAELRMSADDRDALKAIAAHLQKMVRTGIVDVIDKALDEIAEAHDERLRSIQSRFPATKNGKPKHAQEGRSGA